MDMHGKVIQGLPYDPNWEGPVYTGPNQVLGPGFPPFKPYLRPQYFGLRVSLISISYFSILDHLIKQSAVVIQHCSITPDILEGKSINYWLAVMGFLDIC